MFLKQKNSLAHNQLCHRLSYTTHCCEGQMLGSRNQILLARSQQLSVTAVFGLRCFWLKNESWKQHATFQLPSHQKRQRPSLAQHILTVVSKIRVVILRTQKTGISRNSLKQKVIIKTVIIIMIMKFINCGDFSQMPSQQPYLPSFFLTEPQFCSVIQPPSMQPQRKLNSTLNGQ